MIKVGIAEFKTASEPHILSCVGLGSCVGVCLYDPVKKIGGLAHILLPDGSSARNDGGKPGKFADTALDALISKMVEDGSSIKNISAKLVGGASMFTTADTESNGIFQMGPRNVESVKNVLASKGIKLEAEDTGGNFGRTMEFNLATGKITIKTMKGTTEI